jgi:hypothetical protein
MQLADLYMSYLPRDSHKLFESQPLRYELETTIQGFQVVLKKEDVFQLVCQIC